MILMRAWCTAVYFACPEPVEGACPELVEEAWGAAAGAAALAGLRACPEPVEGACPEPVEWADTIWIGTFTGTAAGLGGLA